MPTITIQVVTIDNKKYLTVNQMSAMTNKSTQTIYTLINKGNSIRKIKVLKLVDRLLIPYTELTEFPFTYCGGANSKQSIYHYDEQGKVIEDDNDGKE